MNTVQQVFKTTDNTILIVKATTEGCNNRQYVSVTATEIKPILRSDAVEQCKESLLDGELWRQAVQAEQTELGLEEWAEYVISIDGDLSMFDNSLYDSEIEINGQDYIFDSLSCGCLHDDIKGVTKEFNTLISLHLSDNKDALTQAEKIIFKLQKSANTDIDFYVEKYTREILELQ